MVGFCLQDGHMPATSQRELFCSAIQEPGFGSRYKMEVLQQIGVVVILDEKIAGSMGAFVVGQHHQVSIAKDAVYRWHMCYRYGSGQEQKRTAALCRFAPQ